MLFCVWLDAGRWEGGMGRLANVEDLQLVDVGVETLAVEITCLFST